jgi:putative membrane protein
MDQPGQNVFPIHESAVARYFLYSQALLIFFGGVWFFGIGAALAVLFLLIGGPWLSRQQAQALRYWLDGRTIRVDQGVFFLKRKAIPLDRVTDVVLTQGPLMRWCGIWGLQIQTAGTGQTSPEATLYGVTDPEGVHDFLLKARDEAATRERTK